MRHEGSPAGAGDCVGEVRLEAHLRGELPAHESRRIEEHLDRCARCRELRDDWRAGEELAAALRAARREVPDPLRRRLIDTTTTAIERGLAR